MQLCVSDGSIYRARSSETTGVERPYTFGRTYISIYLVTKRPHVSRDYSYGQWGSLDFNKGSTVPNNSPVAYNICEIC